MRKFADRIQARAIRRCGELLGAIEKGINQHASAGGGTSRNAAARSAGLSHRQQHTALRVAAKREIGARLAGVVRRGNPQLSQRATFDLASVGITRSDSSRWQAVAALTAKAMLRYGEILMETDKQVGGRPRKNPVSKPKPPKLPGSRKLNSEAQLLASMEPEALRAQAMLGEFIARAPKATGGQPYQKATGSKSDPVGKPPSLPQLLGKNHKQVANAARKAAEPASQAPRGCTIGSQAMLRDPGKSAVDGSRGSSYCRG